MARINRPVARATRRVTNLRETTHEGARAYTDLTVEQRLRRSVLSCFLWENEFYEDGKEISSRIIELALQVDPNKLAALAVQARTQHNLRHVPLLLLSVLAKTGKGTSVNVPAAIEATIRRADELPEFLSVFNKVYPQVFKKPSRGIKSFTHGMRKGLSRAFAKFDAYQLAKYDRENAVRLRDVVFLTHPQSAPDRLHSTLEEKARAMLYADLVNRDFFPEHTKASKYPLRKILGLKETDKPKLVAPDTWEVELSAGHDKRETFERLLHEGKLGYLALLRNLRNMRDAKCDRDLVASAILERKGARTVLPFRYVAAARACPQFEQELDVALGKCIEELPRLTGKTVVMVDVSASMDAKLSGKSDLRRMDAAATLAVIIPGDVTVYSFSDGLVKVPKAQGIHGIEKIENSQPNNGTELIGAVCHLHKREAYDRLIVTSDEQAASDYRGLPHPEGYGYVINVASNRNGIGYGPWVHIDGFSEQVIRFISEWENSAYDLRLR